MTNSSSINSSKYHYIPVAFVCIKRCLMTFWTPPTGWQGVNCGYHNPRAMAPKVKPPSLASVEQALRDVAADLCTSSALMGAAATDDGVMNAVWSKIASEDAKKCFFKASEMRKSRGGSLWQPPPGTDPPRSQFSPKAPVTLVTLVICVFPTCFLHIWVVTALVTDWSQVVTVFCFPAATALGRRRI